MAELSNVMGNGYRCPVMDMKHKRRLPESMRLVKAAIGYLILIASFVAGCSAADRELEEKNAPREIALESFLLTGTELHSSLRTEDLNSITGIPSGMILPVNPHVSTDKSFVESTARGGSQGRLDGQGMHSALYARYRAGESEIGFYGLEAESEAAADIREELLREIWAYNTSLDRAHVYRQEKVLFVVWIWTDGALPDCWDAVKAGMEERLEGDP